MSAAGPRIGWVIAGQASTWSNEQAYGDSNNSQARYSYRDIVTEDLLFSVDFAASNAGTFSIRDITYYFAQLCEQQPALKRVSRTDTKRIFDITQGNPQVVASIASSYAYRPDLTSILKKAEHDMIELYLANTQNDEQELQKLYGLAMLRRVDKATVVTSILGLDLQRNQCTYDQLLQQLHNRYHFIAIEQGQPLLHEKVREQLRRWLLMAERETQSCLVVAERLVEAQQSQLQGLERQHNYKSLRDYLEDDGWVNVYLDYIEAGFWLNPEKGLSQALTFLLAAMLYLPDIMPEVEHLSSFFIDVIPTHYRDLWQWLIQCLTAQDHRTATPAELFAGLAELHQQLGHVITSASSFEQEMDYERGLDHLKQRVKSAFPAAYARELEGALWWLQGKLHREYAKNDASAALIYYQEALQRLSDHSALRVDFARIYWDIAEEHFSRQQYKECIASLDAALKIKYDYVDAYYILGNTLYDLGRYEEAVVQYQYVLCLYEHYPYAFNNLGNAYAELKRYEDALVAYDWACKLDPQYYLPYYNRGCTYKELKKYHETLQDFIQAIALKTDYAEAYIGRGNVYGILRDYKNARADYQRAAETDQHEINNVWMAMWASFGKTVIGNEAQEQLEKLIELDSLHYIAHICRAICMALQRQKLNNIEPVLEQAALQEPEQWDTHFWKGIILAFYGQTEAARQNIDQALALGLPPLLLMPLYWLELVVPNFFNTYARPLLEKYDL